MMYALHYHSGLSAIGTLEELINNEYKTLKISTDVGGLWFGTGETWFGSSRQWYSRAKEQNAARENIHKNLLKPFGQLYKLEAV